MGIVKAFGICGRLLHARNRTIQRLRTGCDLSHCSRQRYHYMAISPGHSNTPAVKNGSLGRFYHSYVRAVCLYLYFVCSVQSFFLIFLVFFFFCLHCGSFALNCECTYTVMRQNLLLIYCPLADTKYFVEIRINA